MNENEPTIIDTIIIEASTTRGGSSELEIYLYSDNTVVFFPGDGGYYHSKFTLPRFSKLVDRLIEKRKEWHDGEVKNDERTN
jgi:hypothetical protein